MILAILREEWFTNTEHFTLRLKKKKNHNYSFKFLAFHFMYCWSAWINIGHWLQPLEFNWILKVCINLWFHLLFSMFQRRESCCAPQVMMFSLYIVIISTYRASDLHLNELMCMNKQVCLCVHIYRSSWVLMIKMLCFIQSKAWRAVLFSSQQLLHLPNSYRCWQVSGGKMLLTRLYYTFCLTLSFSSRICLSHFFCLFECQQLVSFNNFWGMINRKLCINFVITNIATNKMQGTKKKKDWRSQYPNRLNGLVVPKWSC